ncbi:MAG: Hsp70 family protein [Mycobacteriaceae bacterium]|nr:Hsp70 family protein [Mycobacteriaceae bacterium]
MYDPLGLSIGTTNLVVARDGVSPVSRRAVLTLFPDGPCEIGLPADNPDRTERLNPGTVIDDFVDRVGRGPRGAVPEGVHDPYALLAEALDAMISVSGIDATWSEIAIAVPAHWDGSVLAAVRDALKAHAGFGRRSVTPRLVPDAVAALAVLSTAVDLPGQGVVGLLDFGGGGTSITLADAGLGFQPVVETVRYQNFSGDRIDRAVLRHVLNDLDCADDLDVLGPLEQECRQAKERLSTNAVTALVAELPKRCCGVRLTRDELAGLIDDHLLGVISAFDDILARNKAARANLAAVALVGGGASIPLVFQRFSSYAQIPVLTVRQPAFAMANGAALLAARGSLADVPTLAAYALAGATMSPPSQPSDEALVDGAEAALPDLAWSQDEDTSGDLTRYAGRFYSDGADSPASYSPEIGSTGWPAQGRNRLPQLLVGLSAVVAMVAIGSAAYAVTSATGSEVSTVPSAPSKVSVSMPAATAVPSSPLASTSPASSASAGPSPSTEPVTTSALPPSTSVATTTYQPSSTAPTTTLPPTTTVTTPSTTAPPLTTTTAEPTSTAPVSVSTTVLMTTQWLRVPLLPVPIPVPVPVPQGAGG